ncbi:MAG: ATP synthase F1 subunit epsilon [Prevotella sp.]|jgi:F-type H+-transporting ATPase subunit epsilon|nr:ATP synthase F1 subunit epsilon [Prevotella sp.]
MLKLKIVSPERVVFSGDVERVTVPGTAGEFEILVNHAPIISSLERGTVTYQSEEGLQSLQVQGGFVSVKKNEVNVCVEV